MPKMCHSDMRESSNKGRMDVWVELGLGFKRFADKAEAWAEGSGVPDGSFSVKKQEDLEYFFYCPQLSHLSVSEQNTDV